MESHLADQIRGVSENERPGEVDNSGDVESSGAITEFFDWVYDNERNDVERLFRDEGKHHQSVIGKNNSCIESMEYAPG